MLQSNYRIARSCGRNNLRACECGLRIFCSWRKLHEKNFSHFDGVLLPCAVICKNVAMPEWVQNYRTVFPALNILLSAEAAIQLKNHFLLQTLALLLYFPAQKAFSFAGENESHFVHAFPADGETL